MTNFNFLLNNLSYLSNEDLVVRPMDSTCFRSALVPPSFRLRLHPLRMVATLLLILCLGVGNVWGAVGGALKTYDTSSSTFKTGYKHQSGDNFVWWGQQGYYGANNATNHGNNKPTAADLPVVKAHNSSATTSTTGLYYCYTSEAVSNVGAVQITFSAKSGSSTVNAYVVSSSTAASSGSATWTKLTLLTGSPSAQGANVATANTYTFTFPKETTAKYYGVVFVTSSYWRATGFQMKLLEGCTAPTAVAKGTLTSSSFALSITDAQNAGNYDVYFSTSSTAPTASTAAGSFSTEYTKTPTISSGVAASTTYYVWARSSKTVSSVAYKSAWVALTGNTLTTPAAAVCSDPAAPTNSSINLIQRKQSEMDFHLVIISVFQRSHYLPFGHLPFGNYYFSVFAVTLFFLCAITRNKFPAHRTRNL